MTTKQAAERLECVLQHVHHLVSRGKLTRLRNGEISEASVERYASTRRLRRKTSDGGFISAKHIPEDLLARFRASIPGGSSLTQCLIEAMELWLEVKNAEE